MSKKIGYFLTFITVFILVLSSNLQSQKSNNPVILMQGKIIDSQTGSPIGTGIQFVNSAGKKMQTKSNPGSGAYTQVLNPNEEYIVMFKEYILVDESKTFATPNVSEYHEMSKDFRVRKIESGMELFRFNAFHPNEAKVEGVGIKRMSEIKELLSYNPKVNILITINTGDCSFKPIKKSVPDETSKKKKKTKTLTITPDQQMDELANARIASIKDYMRQINIPERMATFELKNTKSAFANVPKKESKKKDKKTKIEAPAVSQSPNVVVTVGRILNL